MDHGVLRVALAQLHLPVGDLDGNAERIGETMDWAESVEADVLLCPELAVTGYPPEDLLHLSGFVEHNLAVLDALAARARDCVTIVGFVDPVPARAVQDSTPRTLTNAVALLWHGQVRYRYHKVLLPNYGVFDERRHFAPGTEQGGTWRIRHAEVGVLVCEDLWGGYLADAQAADGAQALLVANASPYHRGKVAQRTAVVTDVARRCGLPVAYCNLVGGEDEVVFDGGSLVAAADGSLLARGAAFEEDRFTVDLPLAPAPEDGARRSRFVCRPAPRGERAALPAPRVAPALEDLEEVYTALVRALADFCRRAGYDTAVIGLSGGVDSSLTAAVAVDALGADSVWGITLPVPTSPPSAAADAAELAARLGMRHDIVPVSEPYTSERRAIDELVPGEDEDIDVLARLRGTLLLSVAARSGGVVLPTGNKTETALGYGTIGGDAAGHFAVLRDVPKMLVYDLCRWRNALPEGQARARGWAVRGAADGAGTAASEVIPVEVITKTPSAERTADRPDREVPASYEVVDAILEAYIEEAKTPEAIAADGHDPEVVARVVDLVERNEGHRRQLPSGVKVTARAFGRDRHMPLVHGWRPSTAAAPPSRQLVPTRDDLLEG